MAFGLFLALVGGLLALADWSLAHDAVAAEGVVTGFSGTGSNAHALVAFTDGQGIARNFPAGSNRDLALSVGDRVQVLYVPSDPSRATVDSFSSRWLLPFSFGVFGLVMAGLAFASLRKLPRKP